MTPEQLDEIEKLAEAATPGPWEPYIGVDYGLTMAEYYACGPYHASHEFDETSPSIVSDGKERADADAALIRAMREYALPLVEAVREAREDARNQREDALAWLYVSQDRAKERNNAYRALAHMMRRCSYGCNRDYPCITCAPAWEVLPKDFPMDAEDE